MSFSPGAAIFTTVQTSTQKKLTAHIVTTQSAVHPQNYEVSVGTKPKPAQYHFASPSLTVWFVTISNFCRCGATTMVTQEQRTRTEDHKSQLFKVRRSLIEASGRHIHLQSTVNFPRPTAVALLCSAYTDDSARDTEGAFS